MVENVFKRYGRAQFLKDAGWIGLTPDTAFSRVELRRQRDRLMILHHPDRGGDADMAGRINETYGRMLGWLERRNARRPAVDEGTRPGHEHPSRSENNEASAEGRSGPHRLKPARIWTIAALAITTYVGLRRRRR